MDSEVCDTVGAVFFPFDPPPLCPLPLLPQHRSAVLGLYYIQYGLRTKYYPQYAYNICTIIYIIL